LSERGANVKRITLILILVLVLGCVITPNTLSFATNNKLTKTCSRETFDVENDVIMVKKSNAAALIKISAYKGFAAIKSTSAREGSFDFTITCEFDSTNPVTTMNWVVASSVLKATNVMVDDKKEDVSCSGGIFTIKLKKPMDPGPHTIKFVYGGLISIPDPPNARLQIYAGSNHFHCYNAWYPVCEEGEFAPKVHFVIDINIPGNWFLLGSFVPKEYRDKPKSDGKYKMDLYEEDPYSCKLVGGDYNVYKEGNEKYNIRLYTFKNQQGEYKEIAPLAKNAVDFFSDYYDHPSTEDFFVASQTARRGNGQALDGGYVIDSPLMTTANMPPEFLSHETAHMSWWGGDPGVLGNAEEPNRRFLSEAFAEFSAILFCYKRVSESYGLSVWRKNLEDYLKFRQPSEPAITNPQATWTDYIMYKKGSLVLWALCNYMGEEAFQRGVREFIKKYAPKSNSEDRVRPTIKDLKQTLEDVYGQSLTPFWNVFFNSSKMVWVDYRLQHTEKDGVTTDLLALYNRDSTDLPMRFVVYFDDGSTQNVVFKGDNFSIKLDKFAVGVDFVDYYSTIPRLTDQPNTLYCSTIAAALSWRKPHIVFDENDGPAALERAKAWEQKTGGKIVSDPKNVAVAPIIFVGQNAINNYDASIYKSLPVRAEGESLMWRGAKVIDTAFDMLVLTQDKTRPGIPIIIDKGTGELPINLAFAAVFNSKDNMVRIAYNYQDPTNPTAPSSDDLLDISFGNKYVPISECRLDLKLTPKRVCTIKYSGFDPEKFEVGPTSIKINPGETSIQLMLDFKDGVSPVEYHHCNRYFGEEWRINFVHPKKDGKYSGPTGFILPKAISSTSLSLKWSEMTKFFYQLDGINTDRWVSGSSLGIDNLTPGRHDFKIVFVGADGLLSPVFSEAITLGALPPKVEIDNNRGLFKAGKIIITGKTDPGVKLNPEGFVLPDGTFKVEIPTAKTTGTVLLTATNDVGLKTSVSVSILKYTMLKMTLGKDEAVDESGTKYSLTVPPQLVTGSTFVPMRFIGERLGATIDWIASEKKVVLLNI